MKINLHAHESRASGDSLTSIEKMIEGYASAGYNLVGFVGHDATPSLPARSPIDVVVGNEHEIRTKPRRLHVVEFPSLGLRYLAHPKLTWPEDTKTRAVEFMKENGIDAVEKYNRGVEQYPGHIDGALELANDDAHNLNQIGGSYFEAGSIHDIQTPGGALRLSNPGYSARKYLSGRSRQMASLVYDRFNGQ